MLKNPLAPSGVIEGCSDKVAWELAVGLLTAKLCQIRGAGRVIVIDAVDYRLEFAKHKVGLRPWNCQCVYATVLTSQLYISHVNIDTVWPVP